MLFVACLFQVIAGNLFFMHKLIVFLLLISVFSSCKKEDVPIEKPPATNTEYTNFNDRQVKFKELLLADLNKDGVNDMRFSTLLVGDAILRRDYHRFYVTSSFDTYLPVNEQEEVPVLSKGATVAGTSFNGYQWYNVASILLAQKVLTEHNPPFWEGFWKDVSHKYLPVLVTKDHKLFYGWIEVSFDTHAENIVVHTAGISKEPGKEIKAGL